ncbi:MAG: cytochrome c oxidase accessory protein CcoG [Opitutales bacterium]
MAATRQNRRPTIDSVTTINEDGSRFFLHPEDAKGPITLIRRLIGWMLIAIYASLPWIQINGYPAVFLDTLHRRFHLFGHIFSVQDVWLLFFCITGLGFTLFLLTALVGRVWCAFACPQTVFLEHVFRRIERLIEGPPKERKRLDRLPWSDNEKLLKRGIKIGIFFVISALIAHMFLAYFISLPTLYSWMHESPLEHWSSFLFVGIFTGILFFNFTWFREQLCIVICPYGRFQSVLIDDDTRVIGYDSKRGEPRGKGPGFGDCINCNKCVQVCPTGIDIRQGLQIECIACGSCADACDSVMDSIAKPKGLVRYDSLNALKGGKRRWFRPRLALYGVFFLVGACVATYSFSLLKPANFGVTRMRGNPYFVTDSHVRNQFQVRIVNKQHLDAHYTVEVVSANGEALDVQGAQEGFDVESMGEIARPLIVMLDREGYTGGFDAEVILHGESANGSPFTIEHPIKILGPAPQLIDQL